MRIETSLKIRDAAKASLVTAYHVARECGLSADALTQSALAARVSEKVKGAPQWVAAFLEGYDSALRDGLYTSGALAFGGMVDGKFYSTDRTRADYYDRNGISPGDFADNGRVTARGFYWVTGATPRPFFLSPVSQ